MNTKVITVGRETPLSECISLMEKYRIRHLLVTQTDNTLLGVLSDRDIRSMLPSRDIIQKPERRKLFLQVRTAEEAMSKNSFTVTPETHVKTAAEIMISRKYGCLPVVSNGKVVGILTITDLLNCLVNLLEHKAA